MERQLHSFTSGNVGEQVKTEVLVNEEVEKESKVEKRNIKEEVYHYRNHWTLITMWSLLGIAVVSDLIIGVKATVYIWLALIGFIPVAIETYLHRTKKGVFWLKYAMISNVMALCFFLGFQDPSISRLNLVFLVIAFTTFYSDKWLLLFTSIPSIAFVITLWMTNKEQIITSFEGGHSQFSSLIQGVVLVVVALLINTKITSYSNKLMHQALTEAEEERERINLILNRVRKSTSVIHESSEFLFEQLKHTSEISEQMNVAFEDIARGTEQQSESTNRIQDATNALYSRVQVSSEMVKNLQSIGNHTLQQTNTGNEKISALENRIKELTETMNILMEIMSELRDKSQNMTVIFSMMDGISNEMNMLALNAQIESAKAGEFGNGFTVVANHFRHLAEQTKKATKDVSEILNEVSSRTLMVNEKVEEGNVLLQQGVEATNDVTNVFGMISKQVDDLFFSIETVEKELNQLTNESKVVLESVDVVASTIEQHSANTEEVFAGIEEQTQRVNEIFVKHQEMNESINNLKTL